VLKELNLDTEISEIEEVNEGAVVRFKIIREGS